jgi:hypothetical protein
MLTRRSYIMCKDEEQLFSIDARQQVTTAYAWSPYKYPKRHVPNPTLCPEGSKHAQSNKHICANFYVKSASDTCRTPRRCP